MVLKLKRFSLLLGQSFVLGSPIGLMYHIIGAFIESLRRKGLPGALREGME